MIGTLRLLAAAAVLLLAGLGVLLAAGAISLERFQDWSLKGLVVLSIVSLAAVALGLLMRNRSD